MNQVLNNIYYYWSLNVVTVKDSKTMRHKGGTTGQENLLIFVNSEYRWGTVLGSKLKLRNNGAINPDIVEPYKVIHNCHE